MNTYLLLLISFAALLLGPWIYHLTRQQLALKSFFDTFVTCSILGIVGIHVLPESITIGGNWSLLAAAIGLLLPLLLKAIFHTHSCHTHISIVSIAGLGIAAHALLDGMALASTDEIHHQTFLAAAIILHRFPEGIGLFHAAESRFGRRAAVFALAADIAVTSLGFFFGEFVFGLASNTTLVVFQALMAGILLHVIFHRHGAPLEFPRKESVVSTVLGISFSLGLVLCLSFLSSLTHHHH